MHIHSMTIRLLFVFAVLTLCSARVSSQQALSAVSDSFIIEGIGKAPSEKAALLEAARNALDKSIGCLHLNEIEMHVLDKKRDMIYSKTFEIINRYTIISSKSTPDKKNYQVIIQTVVSAQQLKNRLEATKVLFSSMEKPRLVVLMIDSVQVDSLGINPRLDVPHNEAQRILWRLFHSSYHFDLIDSIATESIMVSQQQVRFFMDDTMAAASLGLLYGADMLLTGRALISSPYDSAKPDALLKTVKTTIFLVGIDCSTGRKIFSIIDSSQTSHMSPILAGRRALDSVFHRIGHIAAVSIMQQWINQQERGVPLQVTIRRVSSLRLKKSVIQTLSMMPGVVSIEEKQYEQEAGVLHLWFFYRGSVNAFYAKCQGYKLAYSRGSIAVAGQAGVQLTLVIEAQ
ncbi:MAG: hypothetical protein JW795_12065 [Chitinivibrionales bacterium]|nr:hypothetical protein [Chitinivibrionales bacterium]